MKRYVQSFRYAIEGIVHGWKTEKHIRFHTWSAVVVTLLGLWTKLSLLEWSILVLLFGGMIALEYMNAAIERTVDLVTDEYALLAKRAKDVAAGAVLVYAMTSVIVGALLFIPKWWDIG